MAYDHQKIEKKWQKRWDNEKLYEVKEDKSIPGKKRRYILDMFPYPSGAGLHVGHPEGYTATDIYSRYLRMRGYSVLHPMGWDAFGLPAENYAIKQGVHPRELTLKNIDNFRCQIKSLGFSYDWSREISTCDPKYYKWTQWLFLLLYKNGLAYRKRAPVNWCDSCRTVLAHEQVIDGRCERCNNQVIQKELKQWFFKITGYADRLLRDLDKTDWPEPIKTIQRNWIGKSEGAMIKFKVQSEKLKVGVLSSKFLEVFTTRPDTIFGATYMVIAPEHTLITNYELLITNYQEVQDYIEKSKQKTELERTDLAKDKTGVELKGIKAVNPATGEAIPVWVADYVVMGYGTGAIMAVPAHDARDWDFARKYNLPIKFVVAPKIKDPERTGSFKRSSGAIVLKKVPHWHGMNSVAQLTQVVKSKSKDGVAPAPGFTPSGSSVPTRSQRYAADRNATPNALYQKKAVNVKKPYIDEGLLVSSSQFDGMMSVKGGEAIVQWLAKKGFAKKLVQYKLRDWLISRQRYWGAPIPIIYCKECGEVPVPARDLPVELPNDVDFRPTGESPLRQSKLFHNVKCPQCGGDNARREPDTMDTFVCSSWYYFRYTDPQNAQKFASKDKIEYWLPVDVYVGGAEHAVMHLLYARFFCKVLADQGMVDFDEPFKKLINQGLILAQDGRKMSKSLGNVINPDDIVRQYGADSLRMYEMFMGPLEDTKSWSTDSICGIRRFLEKVWLLNQKSKIKNQNDKSKFKQNEISKLLHKTIKKVTEDIEAFKFNTAISQLMILVNAMQKAQKLPVTSYQLLITLLAPFAPHLAEELWERLGYKESIFKQRWPEYDAGLVKDDKVTIVVQVNGRVRGQIELELGLTQEEIVKRAKNQPNIQKWIGGKEVKKEIYVPNHLVNFVV
jgi:leucyl-tRNA synthetase